LAAATSERGRALAARLDRENDEVVRCGNLAIDIKARIARTWAEIERCR
jgi:hypothetical protein